MTNRRRAPAWFATVLVVALVAAWRWWPSSDDVVGTAPGPSIGAAPAHAVARAPMSVTASPAPAQPVDVARSASAFKLIGTVVAANRTDSFALVRRSADSQLVRLRAGDRFEGSTVTAIESDRVVLDGVAHAIASEADGAAAPPTSPILSRALSPPPAPEAEPAWAGDPAPFGH